MLEKCIKDSVQTCAFILHACEENTGACPGAACCQEDFPIHCRFQMFSGSFLSCFRTFRTSRSWWKVELMFILVQNFFLESIYIQSIQVVYENLHCKTERIIFLHRNNLCFCQLLEVVLYTAFISTASLRNCKKTLLKMKLWDLVS